MLFARPASGWDRAIALGRSVGHGESQAEQAGDHDQGGGYFSHGFKRSSKRLACLAALNVILAFQSHAASVVGTPVALAWGTGANPAAQNVTPAAGADICLLYTTAFAGSNGVGMASVTLGGNAQDTQFEVPEVSATFEPWAHVAVWNAPATGSAIALDPAFDAASTDGPSSIFLCIQEADPGWRDADGDNGEAATALSVTLTTVSGDFVLVFDTRFSATLPGARGGSWSAVTTQTDSNGQSTRVESIEATGATQVVDAQNEEYSTMMAVSIVDEAAEPGGVSQISTLQDLGAGVGPHKSQQLGGVLEQ